MSNKPTVKPFPPEETALLCDQIAMILSSGIPLFDGIETLCDNYKDTACGERFRTIYDKLLETGELHLALGESGLFPRYAVSMVKIGERTGRLDAVMATLSAYYTWEASVRSSIKNAILYPSVLLLMMAVVIAILVLSVLPVFSNVFAGLGAELTGSTEGLMRAGVTIGWAVLAVIGALLMIMIVLLLLTKTSKRESVLAFVSALLPPVRRARARLAAARFASVLAIMLKGGCNIDEALQLAGEVAPDEEARKRTLNCAELMQQGSSFASAVAASDIFEPIHAKMVLMGDASGKLDAAMERLAEIYQELADDSIHYLVTLIEPTLVALLSAVIGGILLSVMLPLVSILSSMA